MSGLIFRGMSANGLGLTFAREGRVAHQRGLRHMRRVSQRVLDTAIRYSPVDWKGPRGQGPLHELERSHRLSEVRGGRNRIEVEIEVGGMIGSVNVDLYAMWIHNGSYTRGDATAAKGPKAGPGWLETALQEHEDEFEPLLDEMLQGLMR